MNPDDETQKVQHRHRLKKKKKKHLQKLKVLLICPTHEAQKGGSVYFV